MSDYVMFLWTLDLICSSTSMKYQSKRENNSSLALILVYFMHNTERTDFGFETTVARGSIFRSVFDVSGCLACISNLTKEWSLKASVNIHHQSQGFTIQSFQYRAQMFPGKQLRSLKKINKEKTKRSKCTLAPSGYNWEQMWATDIWLRKTQTERATFNSRKTNCAFIILIVMLYYYKISLKID